MTNIQAALGVAQLEQLPDFIKRKEKNYKLYMYLLISPPSLFISASYTTTLALQSAVGG